MDLEQLLAWLKDRMEDGEYQTAETFLRDMSDKAGTYDDDMGVRDAKINELTAANDSLTAAVQDLKARNYDLLMQIPAEGGDDDPTDPPADDDGDAVEIDDLFDDVED